MQNKIKKVLLSLIDSLRTWKSLMSSPKSYVAETSRRHVFLHSCIFFNVYTFSSALHLSHLRAVVKGFPDPLHVGSTLHFQMEIGQNSVVSHGRENTP